jgi:hypothetical protein
MLAVLQHQDVLLLQRLQLGTEMADLIRPALGVFFGVNGHQGFF